MTRLHCAYLMEKPSKNRETGNAKVLKLAWACHIGKKESQFGWNRVHRGRIILDEFGDVDRDQITEGSAVSSKESEFYSKCNVTPVEAGTDPTDLFMNIALEHYLSVLIISLVKIKMKTSWKSSIKTQRINKIFSAKQEFNLPEKLLHYFNLLYILGLYISN